MTQGISAGDELDYRFSFRGELPGPWLQDGETIVSHTASVVGPIEVITSSIQGDDVVVWVTPTAAAKEGQRARLVVRIETSNSPPRFKSADPMDFVIER